MVYVIFDLVVSIVVDMFGVGVWGGTLEHQSVQNPINPHIALRIDLPTRI
jgi:hypothetical protein